MKNFTCLILITLAIGYSLSTCAATRIADPGFNSIAARLNVLTAGTATLAAVTGDVCGTLAAGVTNCCVVASITGIVTAQITAVRTNLLNAGSSAYKIGAAWAKIIMITNATDVNTTIDTTAAADRSTATAPELKTIAMYSYAMFKADFDAFKTQAMTCFDKYASNIKKIACLGCIDTSATPSPHLSDAAQNELKINSASCDDWINACGKVWNYYHKASFFVQTIALINKKKDATSTIVFPQTSLYYSADAYTAVDPAVVACAAGTATAACTAGAIRSTVCRAFIGVLFATTDVRQGIGRGDSSIVMGTASFVSSAKRLLAAGVLTGGITVDSAALGVDLTSANTLVFTPAVAVAIVAADTASWSDGYVAPVVNATTTTNSTTNATVAASTSSANVLIGTIISALFAVALLN